MFLTMCNAMCKHFSTTCNAMCKYIFIMCNTMCKTASQCAHFHIMGSANSELNLNANIPLYIAKCWIILQLKYYNFDDDVQKNGNEKRRCANVHIVIFHNVQTIFPQCANAKKQGFDNVQIIFHNVQCPKKAVSAMCKFARCQIVHDFFCHGY